MTVTDGRAIPAVLLAAGGSTRMGRTKQLLPYRGQTLVWHAAGNVLAAGSSPVILVTGHDAEAVTAAVADLPLWICHHAAWQAGIGSSLRAGVRLAIGQVPDAAAILIALADQPGVSADHLRALLAAAAPDRIAASAYARSAGIAPSELPGVPAVFPRHFFDALLAIHDAAGAKSVLTDFAADVINVPLARPEDIDSPADFAALLDRDDAAPPHHSHSASPAD